MLVNAVVDEPPQFQTLAITKQGSDEFQASADGEDDEFMHQSFPPNESSFIQAMISDSH